MNRIILGTLFFAFVISNTYADGFKGSDKQERKVLKLINSLPEVVKENQRRCKAHVTILLRAYIQDVPTKIKNYYKVSTSEEKGDRLFTYDWYEVDVHNYQIKYEDMVPGKTISLKQWRKQLSYRSKNK